MMAAALAAIAGELPMMELGGGELTVFDPQALQLHDPPELLDVPALFVPIDDLPGRRHVRDVVGGE